MVKPIGLLIVDDHALFRQGLAGLLAEQADFRVVGQAGSGPEAVRRSHEVRPDVVLMDIHMPGGNGVDAMRALKQEMDVPVLMLTISDKDQDLLGALAAGADGYLLKNAEPEQLCQAIRQVAAGHGALSPEVTAKVIQAAAGQSRHPPVDLTKREVQVLAEVARGLTTAEIALTLVISENTVKTHIRRIMKKLGAANRSEAVAKAAELGLLT